MTCAVLESVWGEPLRGFTSHLHRHTPSAGRRGPRAPPAVPAAARRPAV